MEIMDTLKRPYFVGYVTKDTLSGVTDTQAKKLTHLNIAFAPMADGITVMELNGHEVSELSRIRRANPKLAILVSTGGGNDRGHGDATKTQAGVEKLVNSTMDIVTRYDLNGIDCDWEFPGDTGIIEEKYQHTALMKEYRRQLDRLGASKGMKYWLTTAAGSGQWYLDRTEIAQSHVYLDFINLMTYDSNTGVRITGHHTHLYEPKECIRPQSASYNINLMVKAGVPIEKLLMGVAFYSHRWDDVPNENNGFYRESPRENVYGPGYSEIHLKYQTSMGYTKYFDEQAKAPYLFNGSTFLSFDDPLSIKYKCEYVRHSGMAGAFYWVHASDQTGILFDAMYDNLYF